MVYYHIVKNLTWNVSGISHWPVAWSVSCSSAVKLETLPTKHFVDSMTLLIVETFPQAVIATFSTDSEGSSTYEFFGRVEDCFWVSVFIFLKK